MRNVAMPNRATGTGAGDEPVDSNIVRFMATSSVTIHTGQFICYKTGQFIYH